jgi:hypothetical protein
MNYLDNNENTTSPKLTTKDLSNALNFYFIENKKSSTDVYSVNDIRLIDSDIMSLTIGKDDKNKENPNAEYCEFHNINRKDVISVRMSSFDEEVFKGFVTITLNFDRTENLLFDSHYLYTNLKRFLTGFELLEYPEYLKTKSN